jgi:hypothetical protein
MRHEGLDRIVVNCLTRRHLVGDPVLRRWPLPEVDATAAGGR